MDFIKKIKNMANIILNSPKSGFEKRFDNVAGKNVSITKDMILIDGVRHSFEEREISITIEGDISNLDITFSKLVKVNGSVENLNSVSGDISTNSAKSINTTSGDIEINAEGDLTIEKISTISGDVDIDAKKCNIQKVETISGDVSF